MGPRDVTQAPISQSVLPGMSTKTSQDIPDLTVDNLYIGYNWQVGPDRRQAIIWTNAWILFIGPLGTNFSELLIESFLFVCM